VPEHTMEALIMRVTPQANIIDRSGTTIPAKTAAEARKVLIQTARLQGGCITVQQQGYDPSHPAAGNTLTIYSDARIQECAETGVNPGWRVEYHSWAVDVDGEGTYIVPGVKTALSDARMLAIRLDRPISVSVADIKPDDRRDFQDHIEPEEVTPEPAQIQEAGDVITPVTKAWDYPKFGSVELRMPTDRLAEDTAAGPVRDHPASMAKEDGPAPTRQHRLGRRTLLASLAAAVLIAGGAATTTVLSLGNAASPADEVAHGAPLWQVAVAPRDVTLAAHGVLVTAGAGKGEVFSLADGKPVGTGALPEGRPRIVAGTGSVFAVVAGKDGTNAGFVASPSGVKEFAGIKGTLVVRGAEPFLLTGSGKDQGALVWDDTTWKPVAAPEAGMAPVAASKAGVLWLGATGRLVSATTSASLVAPAAGSKASGWVWADEKSVAVLWDTPAGRVLAVHAIADGKITGQAPAGDGEFRKDGELVVSTTKVFTLQSGTPVASEACADPVPAGGVLWCQSENTWSAKETRPLAPGESPVPSPADLVVTATNSGFAAHPGEQMKSKQSHEEK
jgi:hypothetical protein